MAKVVGSLSVTETATHDTASSTSPALPQNRQRRIDLQRRAKIPRAVVADPVAIKSAVVLAP
jgi:hypothetical protein